ncbi:MAG: nucleotide exchange factor GrpE [Synechococcaceae cyanobacterium]|nr:nucleotide exchange factor GrpE [Synechococcaceae cyanobacterium]
MSGDSSPASDPSLQADQQAVATPTEGDPLAPGGSDSPREAAQADPAPQAEASSATATDRERELENRISVLQDELEQLRSQSLRIAADFDNFRKRQLREQDDLKLSITRSTITEILPVVDNFDRARVQLNPESEEAKALHRSYQNLYKQLVDVLKQLGVAPMRVEGEPFDPNVHEAVMREESHDHAEDVVIEELQRGYHLNGRVLRHALVKVSIGPGPSGHSAAESGEAEQNG